MELQGETPNRLNARATLPDATDSANTIFANRRFQLQKRGQLFIRTHNETLPVAMCVNPDCSSLRIKS